MVAAFLESVDTGDEEETAELAEFARPSMSESLSVMSLAIRLRLGGAGAQPRPFTWGQALRLMTLVLTLTNAVIVSGTFLPSLWLNGRLSWLPAPAGDWVADIPAGVWQTGWSLTSWAWVAAYIALLSGRRRAAQALALIAALPAAVSGVGSENTAILAVSLAMLTFDALLVLCMVTFPDGEQAWSRRWLLALPVGVLCIPVPLFALSVFVPALRLADWPGVTCILAAVAVLTYQLATALRPARSNLPTALALTMLAAWMIVQRLATLPGYFGQVDQRALLTIGLLQAAALLGVGLPLAMATIRAVRLLPPLASSTGAKEAKSP